MCTIVAAFGLCPGLPLVVAANRDEFYGRASSPPALLDERPRVLAGRDGEKGGTWLGATEGGLFVGVTNQRTHGLADRSRRSRGALVLEALRAGTTSAVEALLSQIDPSAYNPFNLMFGTKDELVVAYGRPGASRVAFERLSPGLHVLPNDVVGSRDFPKVRRADALVRPSLSSPWAELEASLSRALADHDRPPLDEVPRPPLLSPMTHAMAHALSSMCIHTPIYGTRSSTIVALSDHGLSRYLYADGPPCQARFTDLTDQLA